MINEIWNDIGGDDDMIARIGSKIKDRESTRRTEELGMKRTASLLKKENVSKKWMEERKMESLLEGMRCLEVGAFEGEWSEHEMLDEWMMAALEEGGLIDDDDAMTGVKNDGYEDIEDMEVMETMDDNSMMEDDEIYEENENEECYEDWLAKELLAMDVDGGTCDLIKRKTTFLNISSNAYYGGGTWYMDRWYSKPAEAAVHGKNNMYSVKDNVDSETQIQGVQTNTVCSFPTEQKLEITRGDMDSDNNIRKRKGSIIIKLDYGEKRNIIEDI
jgi:hypothetical protein